MRRLALAALLASGTFSTVEAQAPSEKPAPAQREASRPRLPDSMTVAIKAVVPVRVDSAVSVRVGSVPPLNVALDPHSLPPPPPMWLTVLGKIGELVVSGAVGLGGVLWGARLANQHQLERERREQRTVLGRRLVRLQALCNDYLNDIFTNTRLTRDTATACRKLAVFWHLPSTFTIDDNLVVDVINQDLIQRLAGLHTDLRRYNRDVEKLSRARDDLQRAHLAGTLVGSNWSGTIAPFERHWLQLIPIFESLEDQARDVCVRAQLLVKRLNKEFDAKAPLPVATWTLSEDELAQQRAAFDAEREALLAESRARLEKLYGPEEKAPPVKPSAPAD